MASVCTVCSGCSEMHRYSPAGRVVRRAGSSSRRSGACRRAAAGPASAASTSSGTSMATKYSTGFCSLPAASSLFWRAFVCRARFAIEACRSQASSYRDGSAELRRVTRDFPARGEGADAPLVENAAGAGGGRGKLQAARPTALPASTRRPSSQAASAHRCTD